MVHPKIHRHCADKAGKKAFPQIHKTEISCDRGSPDFAITGISLGFQAETIKRLESGLDFISSITQLTGLHPQNYAIGAHKLGPNHRTAEQNHRQF